MDYIPAKTILSGYAPDNPWFGCNYNMNLYKGCCHGCIYCDSRSECYQVEHFDTVRAKEHAISILRRELKSKRKSGVIGTGSMSDPYNPFEKDLQLTRQSLELIAEYGFGVSIITKSALITRDIDVLQKIQRHAPVLCKMTVTTCDDTLCKKIEPHVSLSSQRFDAIRQLSEAGLYTGILLMPVLPYITDTEENIAGIVHTAKESGAKFIYAAFGMTLRSNQREYYYEKLDQLFPGLKQQYKRQYFDTYSCGSPRAKRLEALFRQECKKAGLLYKMPDIIQGYKAGYESGQLSFF